MTEQNEPSTPPSSHRAPDEQFPFHSAFECQHDAEPFVVAYVGGHLLTLMSCDLTPAQARDFRDWLNKVVS